MAWTPPKTWAYKESLASNDMNVYVGDNLNYLKDTVDALLPTGIMWIWPTDTAPTGYLLCRGQAISRTTYAALFAIIGTTYGVGDNSTTFNLPNGVGKMFVGKDSTDTLFDALGETGGATTSSALIAHTHTGPSHTHTGPSHTHTGPSHTHTWSDSATTGSSGDNHTHTFSGTSSGQSADHTHYPESGVTHFDMYDSDNTNELRDGIGSGDKGRYSATTGGTTSDHTHTYSGTTSGASDYAHTHSVSVSGTTSASGTAATGASGTDATGVAGTGNTGSAGSGASYSIMNPYQVINYIIKY